MADDRKRKIVILKPGFQPSRTEASGEFPQARQRGAGYA